MTLVIVHYHLRPGGIRRVIELAIPHLVRTAPRPISRIVLATGEAADAAWHARFMQQMVGVTIEMLIEPAFQYISEQRSEPASIRLRVRHALRKLFVESDPANTIVWAHNLGVGRNLLLALELSAACAKRHLPLIAHHHDWWFENRWDRWQEMRRVGVRTARDAARIVFSEQPNILHAAINHADAKILARHLAKHTVWLPNLSEPAPRTSRARIGQAKRWLHHRLGRDGSPIWLVPCRTLRRKNIAEALLLTRWLRPQAWLVVTGAASSADEELYFHALEGAAHTCHWRLRLGVLAGDESEKPGVAELLAASEAVLLTSVQEGFGLPYLEAAAASRPLIARRLPNISPDLHRFGFRFPQDYDEILVPTKLFNWPAERSRQQHRFERWRNMLPKVARTHLEVPPLLNAERPRSVPFSRLTLTAQIEILAQPAGDTWEASAPLNPFLRSWRRRASTGSLRATRWPPSAAGWLSGIAYARRLFSALHSLPPSRKTKQQAVQLQSAFIAAKLHTRNLYPLLWSKTP